MHIKSLHLKNFRCFEEATFEFAPGFNLLIGGNGAGKSSVLDAITESLVEWVPVGEVHTTLDVKKDIRMVLSKNSKSGRFEYVFPLNLLASYDTVDYAFYNHNLVQSLRLADRAGSEYDIKKSGGIFDVIAKRDIYLRNEDPNDRLNLPLFMKMATRRSIFGVNSKLELSKILTKKDTVRDVYGISITAIIDGEELAGWFARRTFERLEGGNHINDDNVLDELSLVGGAITACVEGCERIQYFQNGLGLEVSWKNGSTVAFDNLSDGQRTYIAMVADIARRACLLNPHLDDKVLEETPGIVLIDELDLHLHPKWQRSIVANLTKTFPKIQFIATTHSPQIIGECQPEQVIIVTDRGGAHPFESFGMDSNAVLREIMGAEDRDKEVNDLIDIMFSQIDERKLEAASASLQKLRAKAGNLAEIIEAEHLIARFERESPEAAE
ncbi:MAG: AAA family ATPase [Hyphomicrobiales bacterium]|nr:AAA family ATPase [Hyphomicrobiales bacterium]MDE2113739.1 AAA family ATPase [Hyphomicrobiales bacterium]